MDDEEPNGDEDQEWKTRMQLRQHPPISEDNGEGGREDVPTKPHHLHCSASHGSPTPTCSPRQVSIPQIISWRSRQSIASALNSISTQPPPLALSVDWWPQHRYPIPYPFAPVNLHLLAPRCDFWSLIHKLALLKKSIDDVPVPQFHRPGCTEQSLGRFCETLTMLQWFMQLQIETCMKPFPANVYGLAAFVSWLQYVVELGLDSRGRLIAGYESFRVKSSSVLKSCICFAFM